MSPVHDAPPRRRDDEGDWHELVAAECAGCGCTFHVAQDDPMIVWEPGRAWDEVCTDRGCHCHIAPLIGLRRH